MQRTILIVDDIKSNREILKNILMDTYSIWEASNGQEALDIMSREQENISLVILDIIMPVMDGYQVLSYMKEDAALSQIPVIVGTALSEAGDEEKALNFGARDYITKPFKPTIVKQRIRNIIELREMAATTYLLTFDSLTGLYNRNGFLKAASELILQKEPGYYTIACFDIDKFRVINDQYGTLKGDRVLKHIADSVKEGIEAQGGICCHVAADDFIALYPTSFQDSEELAAIRENLGRVKGLASQISFHVGRYIIDDLSLSVSSMYDRALLALESVKGYYEGKIGYYDEKMREHLILEQSIVNDMEEALVQNQFEAWFQPQYNHATGALIGSEALVRWRRNGQIVPPFKFIPVFEKNGFIYQVDKAVWRQVCEHLRRWLDHGRLPLPVSVNISRYDLFQSDFYESICGLVEEYRLPTELLRLEVTESAFSESPQQIIDIVTELVNYGFIVEIDDFGSGYSSLNTLKDVPAQVLKLDMRFLEASNSQRGGNIIESIVRMAKWLGMAVIAEGIETLEQANYLSSIGCDYIQGYLYAKPMPLEQFELHCNGYEKEERLLRLETVENMDQNAFWDPNSIDTLIFNSYVGSACILEYTGDKIEMLRATKHFVEMLGNKELSIGSLFELDWTVYMDERNISQFRNAVTKSKTINETVYCDYEFKRIPGCPERTVLRSGVRVIATTGKRWLVYCISENITAQREAEENVQRLLAEMQTMMADMPGGFVRIRIEQDSRYIMTFCNDGFCKLLGMDYDTLIKAFAGDPMARIHRDDWHTAEAAMEEILKFGVGSSCYRLIRADGGHIRVTVFGRVSKDSSGNVYLNFYYSDETAREKQTRQREMLMDNLPWGAGIYAFRDGQMNLVYQNKSYWELVGLHEDKFPDPTPMSAIHPDDVPTIMQGLANAIEHHEDVVCDIRLRHLELGYRSVRLVARVLPDETEGVMIVATFVPNE